MGPNQAALTAVGALVLAQVRVHQAMLGYLLPLELEDRAAMAETEAQGILLGLASPEVTALLGLLAQEAEAVERVVERVAVAQAARPVVLAALVVQVVLGLSDVLLENGSLPNEALRTDQAISSGKRHFCRADIH